MQKLIIVFSALLLLAACSKEQGPESTTPAVISNVTAIPAEPTADDDVLIRATITSQYGLYSAWAAYWIGDDIQNAQTVGLKHYYTESQTSVVFSTTIPKQAAEAKVHYQIIAATPASVISGTDVYEYTVKSSPEETQQ